MWIKDYNLKSGAEQSHCSNNMVFLIVRTEAWTVRASQEKNLIEVVSAIYIF